MIWDYAGQIHAPDGRCRWKIDLRIVAYFSVLLNIYAHMQFFEKYIYMHIASTFSDTCYRTLYPQPVAFVVFFIISVGNYTISRNISDVYSAVIYSNVTTSQFGLMVYWYATKIF